MQIKHTETHPYLLSFSKNILANGRSFHGELNDEK